MRKIKNRRDVSFIDQSFRIQGGWIIKERKINPICMSKPRSQQVLEKFCSIIPHVLSPGFLYLFIFRQSGFGSSD